MSLSSKSSDKFYKIGDAIVLLLRTAALVAPPAGAGADLIGSFRTLKKLRQNSSEAKEFAEEIAGRLDNKVRQAKNRLTESNQDETLLNGAVTAVETIIQKIGNDPTAFVKAVQDQESFPAYLAKIGKPYRRNLEKDVEVFFDELLKATAEEIIILAPWSPQFQIGALSILLEKQDEELERLDRIETGVNELRGQGSQQFPAGQIRFGSRPRVVKGFVERAEFTKILD
ncbi:MAG: hypothetical protein CSA83_02440, partial [Actinomycetales bacterium]